MTLYEIYQMIVQASPTILVFILIILSLIEITPIKVNPWKAIVRGIGKALNADTNKNIEALNAATNQKIDDLQTKMSARMDSIAEDYNKRCDEIQTQVTAVNDGLQTHIKEADERDLRTRRNNILDFASAIANGKEFTREKYQQVLKECDEYEEYCEKKEFKNSVAMASMAIIKRSFENHLMANDFPATSEYDEFYSHSDNN